MKKVFSLFMALLYLAVSSGLAVEIHHCMGEIRDFSLTVSLGEKCTSCGMEKGSNKCCKDELRFVKLQDAYKLMQPDYRLNLPEAHLPAFNYSRLITVLPADEIIPGNCLAPPGSPGNPRYLMHGNFRI